MEHIDIFLLEYNVGYFQISGDATYNSHILSWSFFLVFLRFSFLPPSHSLYIENILSITFCYVHMVMCMWMSFRFHTGVFLSTSDCHKQIIFNGFSSIYIFHDGISFLVCFFTLNLFYFWFFARSFFTLYVLTWSFFLLRLFVYFSHFTFLWFLYFVLFTFYFWKFVEHNLSLRRILVEWQNINWKWYFFSWKGREYSSSGVHSLCSYTFVSHKFKVLLPFEMHACIYMHFWLYTWKCYRMLYHLYRGWFYQRFGNSLESLLWSSFYHINRDLAWTQ